MPATVKDLITRYRPSLIMSRPGKVYEDTSDFMRISYGDVVQVGGLHYLVLRDESERRFGIEDPKYWVKRSIVLETGERRILKLVFHESFDMDVGPLKVRCYRSPEKEARVLDLVRGDERFMQGVWAVDEKGNNIRIIEVISGRRLDEAVEEMDVDHKTYFFDLFPGILEKFIGSCEAIGMIHVYGERHGDIRRDHLWLETGTERYRWIDFDYAYDFQENPYGLDLFGLGSILIFLVGKGQYTVSKIRTMGFGEKFFGSLSLDDFSLLFKNRFVNLRRLFPYVPTELNRVLLHFSQGSEVFYETVEEFLEDLRPCVRMIARG
jgi:hypothetical protein